MNSSQKVRTIVAREEGLPLPPPPPNSGEGGNLKRDIPKAHEFDPKALKPLARALFSSSVALGHAITAYKEFSRIKSSSISPDGMLGGKGYVLKVKDVRAKLQQACELLSALTDTLHDEVRGPHWQLKKGDLDKDDAEDVTELLDESDEVLDDPERFGEEELKEVEDGDGPPKTKQMADQIKDSEAQKNETDASKLPGGGGQETMTATPVGEANKHKEASWKAPSGWARFANSSVPVDSLPGPRVNHLDRGEQTGPGGSYNRDEPRVEDDWGRSDGAVPKSQNVTWGSMTASTEAWGESAMPSDDETRTEAYDFGIGYGARGQGSGGYGTKNPDGRGVWGPQSGLPHDPTGPTSDPSGGAIPMDSRFAGEWGSVSESGLPNDGPDPVARADYYEDDKGNLDNVNPHGTRGDSGLPGGDTVNYDYGRDLAPGTTLVQEQQAVPYVKRDWTTHNDRNDMQDLYRMDDNG